MAAAAVICTSSARWRKLNKTQREALKKFEGTLKEENYEKRKGFFKKLKDMFNN